MIRKIISLIVIIVFFANSLSFALSPQLGGTNPDIRREMYALGEKKFDDRGAPGSIVLPGYRHSRRLEKQKPKPMPGLKFIDARGKTPPKSWRKNPILKEISLIDAFKYFRDVEARISPEKLEIQEGWFPVKDNRFPLTRLEPHKGGKWVLVVHPKLIKWWEHLRENDLWYTRRFADGTERTISVAWGIFFRIAKHEMMDLESSKAGRVVDFHEDISAVKPKGGGHFSSFFPIEYDELEANKIGGNYKYDNDKIWLWFLTSYLVGDTTRYDNVKLKQRCEWIFDSRKSNGKKLDEEFPNIKDDFGLWGEAIRFTENLNYAFFTRKVEVRSKGEVEVKLLEVPDLEGDESFLEHIKALKADYYDKRRHYLLKDKETLSATGESGNAPREQNRWFTKDTTSDRNLHSTGERPFGEDEERPFPMSPDFLKFLRNAFPEGFTMERALEILSDDYKVRVLAVYINEIFGNDFNDTLYPAVQICFASDFSEEESIGEIADEITGKINEVRMGHLSAEFARYLQEGRILELDLDTARLFISETYNHMKEIEELTYDLHDAVEESGLGSNYDILDKLSTSYMHLVFLNQIYGLLTDGIRLEAVNKVLQTVDVTVRDTAILIMRNLDMAGLDYGMDLDERTMTVRISAKHSDPDIESEFINIYINAVETGPAPYKVLYQHVKDDEIAVSGEFYGTIFEEFIDYANDLLEKCMEILFIGDEEEDIAVIAEMIQAAMRIKADLDQLSEEVREAAIAILEHPRVEALTFYVNVIPGRNYVSIHIDMDVEVTDSDTLRIEIFQTGERPEKTYQIRWEYPGVSKNQNSDSINLVSSAINVLEDSLDSLAGRDDVGDDVTGRVSFAELFMGGGWRGLDFVDLLSEEIQEAANSIIDHPRVGDERIYSVDVSLAQKKVSIIIVTDFCLLEIEIIQTGMGPERTYQIRWEYPGGNGSQNSDPINLVSSAISVLEDSLDSLAGRDEITGEGLDAGGKKPFGAKGPEDSDIRDTREAPDIRRNQRVSIKPEAPKAQEEEVQSTWRKLLSWGRSIFSSGEKQEPETAREREIQFREGAIENTLILFGLSHHTFFNRDGFTDREQHKNALNLGLLEPSALAFADKTERADIRRELIRRGYLVKREGKKRWILTREGEQVVYDIASARIRIEQTISGENVPVEEVIAQIHSIDNLAALYALQECVTMYSTIDIMQKRHFIVHKITSAIFDRIKHLKKGSPVFTDDAQVAPQHENVSGDNEVPLGLVRALYELVELEVALEEIVIDITDEKYNSSFGRDMENISRKEENLQRKIYKLLNDPGKFSPVPSNDKFRRGDIFVRDVDDNGVSRKFFMCSGFDSWNMKGILLQQEGLHRFFAELSAPTASSMHLLRVQETAEGSDIAELVGDAVQLVEEKNALLEKTKGIIAFNEDQEFVNTFTALIASQIGPGSQEETILTEKDTRNTYEAVNVFHKSSIEILIPHTDMQKFELTRDMDRAIKVMQRRGVSIKVTPYNRRSLLGHLPEEPDGVKRIILSNSWAEQDISRFLEDESNVERFRDVRLLNLGFPSNNIDTEQKTIWQARVIMVAILARIFESGNDKVEALLKEMLQESFHLDQAATSAFINQLGVSEENASLENIKNRVQYFLDNIVRWTETLEREYRFMQKFWTYA